MPGRVGQRLSDDVVGADLDLVGQPLVGAYLQLDRDRRAAGERPEGAAEPALGQDRGVDAARDLAQLVQRAGRSRGGAVEFRTTPAPPPAAAPSPAARYAAAAAPARPGSPRGSGRAGTAPPDAPRARPPAGPPPGRVPAPGPPRRPARRWRRPAGSARRGRPGTPSPGPPGGTAPAGQRRAPLPCDLGRPRCARTAVSSHRHPAADAASSPPRRSAFSSSTVSYGLPRVCGPITSARPATVTLST